MQIKSATLTPKQHDIILDAATEPPYSGAYDDFDETGTYLCRHCGFALFRSTAKFHSGCGWPSFDDEIPGAIRTQPDPDGKRTEINCARCGGHLGHVFRGEAFTAKSVRHCVNSQSIDFVTSTNIVATQEAIFAGGCFWGLEHLFKQLPGVVFTEVGYTGGAKQYPNYEEVCRGTTGHLEAVRVLFDVQKCNFETLARYFFEIHDPTQYNGQGPDIGEQYKSAIFYVDEQQKQIAEKLIKELRGKGFDVATEVKAAMPFYRAEEYHQNYYAKTHKQPYCHVYMKRF